MRNITKQQLLDKISKVIDKLEDSDNLDLDYLDLTFTDYIVDNKKYDRKYCYRQFRVKLDTKTLELNIEDDSEDFVCSMNADDCTKRGYCNGEC